jgi:peptidoglycan/xylan/chitin deacetylase (PgdA/CDA1 family)
MLAAIVLMGSACSNGKNRQLSATRATTAPTAPPSTTTTSTTTTSTTTSTTRPRVTALPTVVDHGPRDRREVTLTFDSNMTVDMLHRLDSGRVKTYANLAVLDYLEAHHIRATFFLAGLWVNRYPDVTRRIASNPDFEIGSHSYLHLAFHAPCYGEDVLPVDQMAADVERSERQLRHFTNRLTAYFRFPGGCYDATALRAIAPAGVTVIQYDDPSGDAFGTSVPAIIAQALDHVQNGSIIVMHITEANAPLTALALPAIVDGLRARGLQIVKLSTLLGASTARS